MSRAEPDPVMANLFRLPRDWVIGAEFLDRPPQVNYVDLEPAQAWRQRRARIQALVLMVGSGVVSLSLLYGLWTALRQIL